MPISTVQKNISIIGLGHIGLPTACILANSGYSVFGIDKEKDVVAKVSTASLITSEPTLKDLLVLALQHNNLSVVENIVPADIYIIAVPTLLTADNKPDLSCVYEVIEAIIPYIKPDDLVVINSTCPIGTTKIIANKIWLTCSKVFIAYCPERAIPGNIIYEILHNHRIIGGINEASTLKAINFYKSFIKGEATSTSAPTAEAVKLAENSYRDLNIAFANELSMIAENIGLNTYELISLANKHPRVEILSPGVGVGGHCLAIDPWFLSHSAGYSATIISRSREINQRKTNWIIQKIISTLHDSNYSLIACLGLTYKANVSSINNSPALSIIEALEKWFKVLRVDPYIDNTTPLYEALINAQVIITLVDHDEFLRIPKHYLNDKIILDFAGVLK